MFIRLQSIAELKSKNRYAQLKNICSKKYSYSQVGAREGGGETGVCIDMSTIWSNPALGKCGQCGKVWQYGNLRVSAAAILPTVGIHRLTQHCHRRLWSLVIYGQGIVTIPCLTVLPILFFFTNCLSVLAYTSVFLCCLLLPCCRTKTTKISLNRRLFNTLLAVYIGKVLGGRFLPSCTPAACLK